MPVEEPLSQLEPAVELQTGTFRQEWHSWLFRLVRGINAITRKGVIDGSQAAPGEVGEFLSVSREAGPTLLALTSTVPGDVVSLPLTPGDWKISSAAHFATNTQALITDFAAGISEISQSIGFFSTVARFAAISNLDGTSVGHRTTTVTPPSFQFLTSVPKTLFLVAKSEFSGAGAAVFVGGYIGARRMR